MRRETFSTPEPIRLDLRVPAGEVEVQAAEVTETTVELEPAGGADSAVAVAETRIELRDRALFVDVPPDRGIRLFSRGTAVRLRVLCPTGCDLAARTPAGDLRAAGRFGSVDLDSPAGDLEVEAVDGDASVKAASADVALGRVGGVATIRTASGDVSVEEAGSSVTVTTASGDQRLGSVRSGRVTLRAASGDIWVGIRRGSAVWLDLASISGDTTSELDVTGASPAEPEEEGPLVELRAQTMSGDIHVARAAAPSELGR